MKRKILLAFGAALLVLTTSCGPKRYGCNKKRCIVNNTAEKGVQPTATATKNA